MDRIVLPIVTASQIMSWGPCPDYTEERVEGLVGDGLNALGILGLEIPAPDRLWGVLRPEMIPEPILGGLACDFAERVLPIFERRYPQDLRPRRAIEARRKHLRGEIDDPTLAAARAGAGRAFFQTRNAGGDGWAVGAAFAAETAADIDRIFNPAFACAETAAELSGIDLEAMAFACAETAAAASGIDLEAMAAAWGEMAAHTIGKLLIAIVGEAGAAAFATGAYDDPLKNAFDLGRSLAGLRSLSSPENAAKRGTISHRGPGESA